MGVPKEVIDAQLRDLQYFDEFFTRKEINHLPEVIREGEVLRALISGMYNGTTWLIVATNQRVIFLDKGLIYGLKQLDLSLDMIQGIAHKTGLLFGEMTITTGGAAWRVEQLFKKGTRRFAEIVSEQILAAKAPRPAPVATTAPAAGAGDDFISRLERLAKLKESGILTEQEFQAQKQRILGEPHQGASQRITSTTTEPNALSALPPQQPDLPHADGAKAPVESPFVWETTIRTGSVAGDQQALDQARRTYEPQGLVLQVQPMPDGGMHVRALRGR